MNESTVKKLQEEIDHLHTLVVFLSSALLRKVVVKLVVHRPFMTADAEKLVSEADDCFRCARMPGLKREIAEGLEVAGHELMAKAVEIDTRQERAKKKTRKRTRRKH